MSEFELTGEEEVIAKPEGREYTLAEEESAKSEMTFYGSSEWCKMVAQWQKDNPLKKKIYTPEEISRSDAEIQRLNEEWKKIKEAENKKVAENRQRLGIDW